MDNTFLNVNEENLAVSYDGLHDAPRTILFLYGGGTVADKDRFRPWQENLARDGVASVSFDYSGCGASSGVFEKSSLARRIDEALSCTKWIIKNNPKTKLTLYGSSMGAYTALGVFRKISEAVTSMMLVVPAAYAPEAHDVPFGPKFTEILRKDHSWRNSLSFSWIGEFTGNLTIIGGELDTVVPHEIPKLYMQHAEKTKNKTLHILPGATHTMLGTRNIGKTPELDHVFALLTQLLYPPKL